MGKRVPPLANTKFYSLLGRGVVFVYPIPKCSHKKTVDLVNRVGFQKIYRQELTIILFNNCTDISNVLCLSLLEVEEHFGSDILDKHTL